MATVSVPATALPDPGDDMDAEQVRDWINNIISFLEGTNIDEDNVDLSSTNGIVGKSTAQTITGLKSWESTAAAAGGIREVAEFGLDPSSGTAADNDGGRLVFYADDDGGTETDLVRLDWIFTDTANGSEDSRVDLSVRAVDTMGVVLRVGYDATGATVHTIFSRDAAAASVLNVLTLEWDPDSGTPANNQGVGIAFRLSDDENNQQEFGSLDVVALDVDHTGTSEDAALDIRLINTAATETAIRIDAQNRVIDVAASGTAYRIDLDVDNDTSIRASADNTIDFEIGGSDTIQITANILDMVTTGNRIDLDTDNDTSIRASADDTIAIEVAANDELIITASAFYPNTDGGMDLGTTTPNRFANLYIDNIGDTGQTMTLTGSLNWSGDELFLDHANARIYVDATATEAVGGEEPKFQINEQGLPALALYNYDSDDIGAQLWLCRSNSNTIGAHSTALADGSTIGEIKFSASDGADFNARSAIITALVDGTAGSNDTPTALTLSTCADGAQAATERIRIDSTGAVGVGVTPATAILHTATSDINDSCGKFTHTTASTPVGVLIDFTAASPDNNSQYFIQCVDSTTARLFVWADGDLANHDGTYGTISDQKFKSDIQDARSYWDDFSALQIRKFKHISDGPSAAYRLGTVAQEVETVFPGLVPESPDDPADLDPEASTYKWVKDSVIWGPIMATVVQELQARVEALELI